MVFGEGYDNCLWLLLAGDKVNRKRIAESIKNMPSELVEKIQTIVKESQGKNKVYVESSNEYYFKLRIKSGILYICFDKRDKKGLASDSFTLSLIPMCKEQLVSRKYKFKKYIGWFEEERHTTDSDVFSMEYNLLQGLFGTVVKVCYENIEREVTYRFNKVNVKRMPDKIFIHQLEDENKLNRLVRERVKK